MFQIHRWHESAFAAPPFADPEADELALAPAEDGDTDCNDEQMDLDSSERRELAEALGLVASGRRRDDDEEDEDEEAGDDEDVADGDEEEEFEEDDDFDDEDFDDEDDLDDDDDEDDDDDFDDDDDE